MRIVLAIAAVLFLGGIAAALVYWAAGGDAAGWAFGLGSFGLGLGVTVWMSQWENWDVPGDRPALRRHVGT